MSGEFKTLKEWFGDATRGDGRKFIEGDDSKFFWFEPFFKDANSYWHVLSQNGLHHAEDENDVFKLWRPPKKKKKLWLWAEKASYVSRGSPSWIHHPEFLSEEEASIVSGRNGGPFIKIEGTMIEVDE